MTYQTLRNPAYRAPKTLTVDTVFTRASGSWLIQDVTYQQELDEILKEEPNDKPAWELASRVAVEVARFYSRPDSLAPMRGWLADHFNVEGQQIKLVERL